MATRFYLSNISPAWPIWRQEKILAAHPDWPGVQFRDELRARERQGHSAERLEGRASALRPTSMKRNGEMLTMVSPAVFAWSVDELMECTSQAAARGASVRFLDCDLTIKPDSGAADLQRLAEAWRRGRKAKQAQKGHIVSVEVRRAKADAGVAKIADRWGLPSSEHSTADLIAESGVSLNTIKDRLGPRPIAQKAHQAALKRAAKRAEKELLNAQQS